MKVSTLDELFMEELKDIYDAEHQLVEALPKMAEAATDQDLAAAFTKHLEETENQIGRLEQVFEACGEKAERQTCEAMKGLLKEGDKSMKEADEPAVRDAALVAAAQKVEHYEIATYGTLITWARMSGWDTEQGLLQDNLDEEKAADEKLTELAENGVNAEAQSADGDEGEDAGERSSAGRTKSSTATSSSRSRPKAPARSRAKR